MGRNIAFIQGYTAHCCVKYDGKSRISLNKLVFCFSRGLRESEKLIDVR
jgi:hypothetical protein